MRVLYVEDDKSLQYIVAQMLELLGYEVACADNGQAGIEKAKGWRPDVILMDVRMPVMDGPEAIRRIRDDPDVADTLIFVLSAYTDSNTRARCERAGADQFFTKPPDMRKIDTIIRNTLEKRNPNPG